MRIKVNNYLLKNPKISSKKIILNISDIHGNIDHINGILKYLEKTKVDYILIDGDITDYLTQSNSKEFLNKIKMLTKYATVYSCIGNHDISTLKNIMVDLKKCMKYDFFEELKDYKNLYLLYDKFNNIDLDDNISISAVNFPVKYYIDKEKKDLFLKYVKDINKDNILDKNRFNITLCHSPNNLANKNKLFSDNGIISNSNLILSGHNHGGLIPTTIQDLFNNHYGLVGPYRKIFQKNSYGIISDSDRSLLISNGVTKFSESAPLKFTHNIGNKLFMPEVDLIYLENGENHSLELVKRKVYKL